MPNYNMEIYIKDGKVLATEYTIMSGIFLIICLLVLAVFSLLMLISDLNGFFGVLSLCFMATSTLFALPLNICPMAILYMDFLSLFTAICSLGVLFSVVGIYRAMKTKKKVRNK